MLARNDKGLMPIMIEGKVNETFGPLVSEWIVNMSPGKAERLDYLCDLLHLNKSGLGSIRYQLLHRTASAIITSRKFQSKNAVVLVHSFSAADKSFEDYSNFLKLYNLTGKLDSIVGPVNFDGILTYWGWVKDKSNSL